MGAAGSNARPPRARHDEHPFNAPLITDSLLTEARSVWAKPRGRGA